MRAMMDSPSPLNRSIKVKVSLLIFVLCFFCVATKAQPYAGPVIEQYGAVYPNESDAPLPKDFQYKVAFDVQSTPDSHFHLNRDIETAARFLNMMGQNNIPKENVHVVVILRGRATKDALKDDTYERLFRQPNPNYHLLSLLKQNGVKIYVDSQSLGFWGLLSEDISNVVELTYSSITQKALLQGEGYIINP